MANIVKKPVAVNISVSILNCRDIKSVFLLLFFLILDQFLYIFKTVFIFNNKSRREILKKLKEFQTQDYTYYHKP